VFGGDTSIAEPLAFALNKISEEEIQASKLNQ
jgi:hypothetical protein